VQGFSEPIRVLAVHRNRILREGLSVLIGMEADLELIGSAAALDAALAIFIEKRPDLTLMDLDWPSDSGVDAILRIRTIDPGAWVIALVTYEWDSLGRRAVEAGAAAVVAKDLIAETLVPMIRAGRRQGVPES
jgi:DNA-binding NarL/FixJ family response regulator